MDLLFKDNRGADFNLWSHEQNKHMTCFTTLRAQCQSEEDRVTAEHAALVGYFRTIVDRFDACEYQKKTRRAQSKERDIKSSQFSSPSL